eukprot:c27216_g1_i4 orf=114-329(+)
MQYLAGYMFPKNPIANTALTLYGHMPMQQAVLFLADFKLGHYMKIPPQSMFLVQVILCSCVPPIVDRSGWR